MTCRLRTLSLHHYGTNSQSSPAPSVSAAPTLASVSAAPALIPSGMPTRSVGNSTAARALLAAPATDGGGGDLRRTLFAAYDDDDDGALVDDALDGPEDFDERYFKAARRDPSDRGHRRFGFATPPAVHDVRLPRNVTSEVHGAKNVTFAIALTSEPTRVVFAMVESPRPRVQRRMAVTSRWLRRPDPYVPRHLYLPFGRASTAHGR